MTQVEPCSCLLSFLEQTLVLLLFHFLQKCNNPAMMMMMMMMKSNKVQERTVSDDCVQYIERVLLLLKFVVTGPKQRLFPLALQIQPTVCHVVSYVCLSQQYKGQFGQYKLFFSDESAEIILLRLEK